MKTLPRYHCPYYHNQYLEKKSGSKSFLCETKQNTIQWLFGASLCYYLGHHLTYHYHSHFHHHHCCYKHLYPPHPPSQIQVAILMTVTTYDLWLSWASLRYYHSNNLTDLYHGHRHHHHHHRYRHQHLHFTAHPNSRCPFPWPPKNRKRTPRQEPLPRRWLALWGRWWLLAGRRRR